MQKTPLVKQGAFSNNISDDTEHQQNDELRDPDRLISVKRMPSRSDIIDVRTDHAKQNDRQGQQNDRIITEGFREVEADQSHEHTRDTASGALKARDQTHGTRDPHVRERHEYVIRKPHEKQDPVPSDHADQSFFQTGINGFQLSC